MVVKIGQAFYRFQTHCVMPFIKLYKQRAMYLSEFVSLLPFTPETSRCCQTYCGSFKIKELTEIVSTNILKRAHHVMGYWTVCIQSNLFLFFCFFCRISLRYCSCLLFLRVVSKKGYHKFYVWTSGSAVSVISTAIYVCRRSVAVSTFQFGVCATETWCSARFCVSLRWAQWSSGQQRRSSSSMSSWWEHCRFSAACAKIAKARWKFWWLYILFNIFLGKNT